MKGRTTRRTDFTAIEYKREGCVVATDEQLARIASVPKREFRRRGINQHTLEKNLSAGTSTGQQAGEVCESA